MLHARLRIAGVMPTAAARARLAEAVVQSCAIEQHLRRDPEHPALQTVSDTEVDPVLRGDTPRALQEAAAPVFAAPRAYSHHRKH